MNNFCEIRLNPGYSHVDMLRVWYKFVKFGTKKSPGSQKWCLLSRLRSRTLHQVRGGGEIQVGTARRNRSNRGGVGALELGVGRRGGRACGTTKPLTPRHQVTIYRFEVVEKFKSDWSRTHK